MLATTDRGRQLDGLLGSTIAAFDIPRDVQQRIVRRYEDVGVWLDRHWAGARAGGAIYPQGSIRLGTIVQPVTPGVDYDIDLVCRRDLSKLSTTQAELKADVGAGLRGYTRSGPEGGPSCEEGKRCWTLTYPNEPFHMDVLPAIPDPESASSAILLTDRELRIWQHSDPIGFAQWFYARMGTDLVHAREAQAREMDLEDVPDWMARTGLQRTVQALKRHRDLCFRERPDDRPASIIITTLAARAYVPGGSLYESIAQVVDHMVDHLESRRDGWWVANPVHPEENFADRWRAHSDRADHFFEWWTKAQRDVRAFGEDLGTGVDSLLEKFSHSFGEDAARRAGAQVGAGAQRSRDAGNLRVAGTGALTIGTTGRAVRPHTFHGDAPPPSRP